MLGSDVPLIAQEAKEQTRLPAFFDRLVDPFAVPAMFSPADPERLPSQRIGVDTLQA